MPIITARDAVPETKLPERPTLQVKTQTDRQLDKVEAPATDELAKKEETGAKPEEEMISPKYAALAKREANLRLKAKELQLEREAMKAEKAKYESDYVPKSQLQERLKSDPLTVMHELGVTYDELTSMILNAPQQADPQIVAIQQKLKAIEETQEKSQKSQAEQQTKAYEQAVSQIRNQAKLLVDSNEEYSTIKERDSVEAIVDLIKLTHEEEGIVMNVEEAAKLVEEHLLEDALKMAQLRKVKAKLNPTEDVSDIEPETKQNLIPKNPPMKTLTNTQMPSASKPLSAKDRAILAFQGKLNS